MARCEVSVFSSVQVACPVDDMPDASDNWTPPEQIASLMVTHCCAKLKHDRIIYPTKNVKLTLALFAWIPRRSDDLDYLVLVSALIARNTYDILRTFEMPSFAATRTSPERSGLPTNTSYPYLTSICSWPCLPSIPHNAR